MVALKEKLLDIIKSRGEVTIEEALSEIVKVTGDEKYRRVAKALITKLVNSGVLVKNGDKITLAK